MAVNYLTLLVLPCVLLLGKLFYDTKKLPLPPAPPADPLIGHLRIAPSSDFHLYFYELGKKYGGIMHLNFAGKMMIILNNVNTAVELLDKRSAIYSDRGPLKILNIMGWTENLARMRYGKTFHQHRRMFHENFNKTIVAKFQPIQTREARLLVQNLCEHPEDREKYLSRFAVSIITRIGFGHHVDAEDDPYVALAVETSETLAKAGSGGGMLIEIFPFLQYMPWWFPGTKYVQYAKHQAPRVRELYDFPFREVQAQTARGSAGASIMASQLEAHSREGDDIGYSLLDIKGMGATMYVAGVDTTSSSLSIFILAMTLYPECQARAQEELDAVVGTDRLPDFNDRGSLPYLEGIIRETLRWHHPIPSGAPHRVMEDDVYDGMFVPKGSMVIANIRGMTWDESLYSDPFGFDPARYARGEPPPAATWGFGRRKCPGRHLADASLWIAMATILSTLSITKAVDTDGNSITPETKFETSLTSHPCPYQCQIKPRSPSALALVQQADTSDNY